MTDAPAELLAAVRGLTRRAAGDRTIPTPERDALLETTALLGAEPSRVGATARMQSVVSDHLDEALASATTPLAPALIAAAPTMDWVLPYDDTEGRGDLGESYTSSVFVGPANTHGIHSVEYVHDGLLVSFSVQAPHTVYPRHRHVASELYLPLTGVADWYRETDGWRTRRPGEWIAHPSMCGHAIRTGSDAVVAMAIWTDNVDCEPPILELD